MPDSNYPKERPVPKRASAIVQEWQSSSVAVGSLWLRGVELLCSERDGVGLFLLTGLS